MTEMAGTPIPHAPGFIANTTPRIVTSRFDYEDSHTLARYESTGGYQGLKKALQRTPEEVHSEVRDATLLDSTLFITLLKALTSKIIVLVGYASKNLIRFIFPLPILIP